MSEWPAPRAPFGAHIDLPFEAGDPDPQDIQYADLGRPWVPGKDWRDAQRDHVKRTYGEYAPMDEEQTDVE